MSSASKLVTLSSFSRWRWLQTQGAASPILARVLLRTPWTARRGRGSGHWVQGRCFRHLHREAERPEASSVTGDIAQSNVGGEPLGFLKTLRKGSERWSKPGPSEGTRWQSFHQRLH